MKGALEKADHKKKQRMDSRMNQNERREKWGSWQDFASHSIQGKEGG